jgi:hypothetical protein
MSVIPKWKVTVTLTDRDIAFWISEPFLSNVLRTLVTITFKNDEPLRVTVERDPAIDTLSAIEPVAGETAS